MASCAKTRPSRHRRKNCVYRNQAKTLAREQVTRRPPTLDCGSTHRCIGCVSFIIIIVGTPVLCGSRRSTAGWVTVKPRGPLAQSLSC